MSDGLGESGIGGRVDRRRRWWRAVVWAVTAMALVAGCSRGESASTGTDSVMSAEQVAAMADGQVDYDEYHEGSRRFIACLSDRGYEVLMEEESYDLVNFGVPEAAVESGDEAECYEREFRSLDVQWQEDHFETSEDAMIMARCLEAHGLEVPETVAEKDAALRANNIPFQDCLWP